MRKEGFEVDESSGGESWDGGEEEESKGKHSLNDGSGRGFDRSLSRERPKRLFGRDAGSVERSGLVKEWVSIIEQRRDGAGDLLLSRSRSEDRRMTSADGRRSAPPRLSLSTDLRGSGSLDRDRLIGESGTQVGRLGSRGSAETAQAMCASKDRSRATVCAQKLPPPRLSRSCEGSTRRSTLIGESGEKNESRDKVGSAGSTEGSQEWSSNEDQRRESLGSHLKTLNYREGSTACRQSNIERRDSASRTEGSQERSRSEGRTAARISLSETPQLSDSTYSVRLIGERKTQIEHRGNVSIGSIGSTSSISSAGGSLAKCRAKDRRAATPQLRAQTEDGIRRPKSGDHGRSSSSREWGGIERGRPVGGGRSRLLERRGGIGGNLSTAESEDRRSASTTRFGVHGTSAYSGSDPVSSHYGGLLSNSANRLLARSRSRSSEIEKKLRFLDSRGGSTGRGSLVSGGRDNGRGNRFERQSFGNRTTRSLSEGWQGIDSHIARFGYCGGGFLDANQSESGRSLDLVRNEPGFSRRCRPMPNETQDALSSSRQPQEPSLAFENIYTYVCVFMYI